MKLGICFFFSFLSHLILASIIPSHFNQHISQELYDNLSTYAHLIDISYCISPVSKIRYPFQCDNDCERFNNTEIVFQWTTNDFDISSTVRDSFVTSGYIALNHDWKTILVVLRGTRSFKDTIVDIDADMATLPSTRCLNCKIHKGFYRSYINTWDKISDTLSLQIVKHKKWRILVMGHSLGGAISLLVGLRVSQIVDNSKFVSCITMGQPKVGNEFFSNYVDQVFDVQGSSTPFETGRLLRVTHKNDPIVQLPWSDDYLITDRYVHSANEIFIDEVGMQKPVLENVVYCLGNSDVHCASGMGFTRDNREHLNYFRTMGKCGIGFF